MEKINIKNTWKSRNFSLRSGEHGIEISRGLTEENIIGERKMKKAENRYVIIDTFTGDMVDFVATEARAKKITATYDTLDYREMKLFDQEPLSNKHKKKGD